MAEFKTLGDLLLTGTAIIGGAVVYGFLALGLSGYVRIRRTDAKMLELANKFYEEEKREFLKLSEREYENSSLNYF